MSIEQDHKNLCNELKRRAMELCPDYPYFQHTPYEYLWALTESLKGTQLACNDLHRIIEEAGLSL